MAKHPFPSSDQAEYYCLWLYSNEAGLGAWPRTAAEGIPQNPKQFFVSKLCWFAKASITKYHGLGDLNNRNLYSHTFGGQKSEIKALQGWFLLKPVPWPADGRLLAVSSQGLSSARASLVGDIPEVSLCPGFLFLRGQQSD